MSKPKPKAKKLYRKTILHVLTGSIAAYKAPDLIRLLRDKGARVICVMTQAAKEFVTPTTLRSVSGERVYEELFPKDTSCSVLHTSLAEVADLVLVEPASANFIARLAGGLADDLPSCAILATKKPVVVVPAMNDAMYEHPLTQANMKRLKEIGYHFIDPIHGRLVCGKEAVGHVANPETIVSRVESILQKKSTRK